jgi:hypothetical protein
MKLSDKHKYQIEQAKDKTPATDWFIQIAVILVLFGYIVTKMGA